MQSTISIEKLQEECELIKHIVLDLTKETAILASLHKEKKKAMSIKELASAFNISELQANTLCRCKGSPAFKIGEGKSSNWMCFPDKFEAFLQKKSEQWKG